MKMRYKGDHPADLPTIGLHVEPGDVVEVPDGFQHPRFEPVDAEAPPKGRTRATAATDPGREGDA